jgi:predicted nuclease of predicted toxin-antitoxin system
VKVLVDGCVAGSVPAALAAAGHQVERVADWPADPGDAVILSRALGAGQVVLTLDKDFGELHGSALIAPKRLEHRPDAGALRWHNEHVFRA